MAPFPCCNPTSPLSSRWCPFRPDMWARLRLESIGMDKICTRIVEVDLFLEVCFIALSGYEEARIQLKRRVRLEAHRRFPAV